MRVLIVSTNDIKGGAARGAYILHEGFKKIGFETYMVVQRRFSNDPNVITVPSKFSIIVDKLRGKLDKLPQWLYRNREYKPWSVGWVRNPLLIKKIKELNPDVIHLHWVNRGFLSLYDLRRLQMLGKPIVWKLADQWVFTGGCHYSNACEKYKKKCGLCPQLSSKKINDLSRKMWEVKSNAYSSTKVSFVTPSSWLRECAKSSMLLQNEYVTTIPNSVDSSIFKNYNKFKARKKLGLPKNRKYILFGAMSSTTDSRKGFRYLINALRLLRNDYTLLVFGSDANDEISDLGQSVEFMGKITDDKKLAQLYSAADVFVGPSLEEAFGLTFIESMACATPPVAFDYSGPKDIIDHKQNGYLAKYKDAKDLAKGIQWCIEDGERNKKLGENARKKAEKEYSLEVQAKRYKELYERLLE